MIGLPKHGLEDKKKTTPNLWWQTGIFSKHIPSQKMPPKETEYMPSTISVHGNPFTTPHFFHPKRVLSWPPRFQGWPRPWFVVGAPRAFLFFGWYLAPGECVLPWGWPSDSTSFGGDPFPENKSKYQQTASLPSNESSVFLLTLADDCFGAVAATSLEGLVCFITWRLRLCWWGGFSGLQYHQVIQIFDDRLTRLFVSTFFDSLVFWFLEKNVTDLHLNLLIPQCNVPTFRRSPGFTPAFFSSFHPMVSMRSLAPDAGKMDFRMLKTKERSLETWRIWMFPEMVVPPKHPRNDHF